VEQRLKEVSNLVYEQEKATISNTSNRKQHLAVRRESNVARS